jgi:hypothetical protein
MAFVLSQVSLVVGPQEDLDDCRANNKPARHYGYHIKALSSATLSLGMPKRGTTIKARWTIALSMLVGIALGAAAIKTLQAQAKPPVYMIAINEVSNQEGYTKEYVPPLRSTLLGSLAAHSAGAAVDHPANRVSWHHLSRTAELPACRIPSRPEGSRLSRGSDRQGRISVGSGPV